MGDQAAVNDGSNAEPTGLEGTPFKSGEEAAKGYLNLKALHDAQANELGTLRKFAETVAPIVQEHMNKTQAPAAAPKGPDYETEIAAVQKQIQDLDPMADNYQKTLADLVAKSNKLVATAQHEKTLSTAKELFQKELSDRDAKAARAEFNKSNPSFSTPEMQTRIQAFLANDKTGMHDPMSAYFQIQKDDLAAENAEMKKTLELVKGKENTGKVVVKGQAGQPPTKPQKATGADLDARMAAALATQRGA
ncbi:MAG TPA: hypothetical protein PK090_09820 [Smithellaceae bacterium]|nr:hypothetical protein [Smithellaceae bacterium]